MRPLLVVVLHPPLDPLPCRLERVELRTAKELLPDRLPESLDFPKRLGMVRGTAEVVYPVTLQHLLEPRLPSPVRVLPPVVRQHLLGHPVLAGRPLVHLQNVLRRLRTVQSQSHDVPGMIVDEPDQVRHLPAQVKRKDVALPHLVRRAALEKTRLRGIALRFLLYHRHQLLGVQRPPYRRRARRQEEYPPQQLRDPFDAKLRVRTLDLDDLFLDRRQRSVRPALGYPVAGPKPFLASLPVPPDPVKHRPARDPDLLRHQPRGNPFLQIEFHGLAPRLE